MISNEELDKIGKSPVGAVKMSYVVVLFEEVQTMRAAIRKHRDTKGHDRCWENDQDLYALLPEHADQDRGLPSKDEFMARCQAYYESQTTKKPEPCQHGRAPGYGCCDA